ncbi:hypothetical protein SELMODRAFT_443324 [Selaginella moellendorffii]|uniref:Uncharacterized protein n=1 Tax=Selaginella moellendorffii TaxID=88036 RepID=D8S0H4_SELML|nr:hypothetical protein SELMODRAFT_443324 [Selaginella moellendorffii]
MDSLTVWNSLILNGDERIGSLWRTKLRNQRKNYPLSRHLSLQQNPGMFKVMEVLKILLIWEASRKCREGKVLSKSYKTGSYIRVYGFGTGQRWQAKTKSPTGLPSSAEEAQSRGALDRALLIRQNRNITG